MTFQSAIFGAFCAKVVRIPAQQRIAHCLAKVDGAFSKRVSGFLAVFFLTAELTAIHLNKPELS
jgi:hypothetical protein